MAVCVPFWLRIEAVNRTWSWDAIAPAKIIRTSITFKSQGFDNTLERLQASWLTTVDSPEQNTALLVRKMRSFETVLVLELSVPIYGEKHIGEHQQSPGETKGSLWQVHRDVLSAKPIDLRWNFLSSTACFL